MPRVAPPVPPPSRPPSRIESAVKVPWRTGTSAVVGDLTEDEIMARLDAILPSDSYNGPVAPEPPLASPTPATHAEPRPVAPHAGSVAVAVQSTIDSYDAEGAVDAPVAAESDFEAASEIVLEPLPLEPMVSADATDLEAPPTFESRDSERSDVVPFDARRSKKRKKNRNRAAAEPEAPRVAASPSVTASRAAAPARDLDPGLGPSPIAASAVVEPYREPPVADPLRPFPGAEEASPRRGLSLWLWAGAAAVIVGGVYFAFFRGAPVGSSATETAPPETVQRVPAAEPTGEPTASAQAPEAKRSSRPRAERTADNTGAGESRTDSRSLTPAPSAAKSTEEGVVAGPPPAKKEPAPAAAASKAATLVPSAKTPSPAPAPRVAAAPPELANDAAGLGVEPVPVQIATPSQTTTKRSVQTGDLVPLSDVDYAPVAVNRAAPQYTPRARLARQQGTVVLNLLVDESGRVADVQVLKPITGSDLDVAAVKAARTWTYKPAVKDGVNVKVWKAEQVVFKP